ncbi:suppressor of Mek1 isoform X2 [Labeo rohita]|uniref:suppressor of Mek1 isoform X2 n=1 Tax=Labeo rohita TaxID=84645 RepID=UPI0021E2E672|nr:suppressor of Mek1 isoform X2 [Labeo rohita]
MTALWEVFYLFVCVLLSKYNAVTAVIYVENGKNMTLDPYIPGEPEEILWTFNGNKVAEYDSTGFQEYGQFRGRSEIEFTTAKLTVRRMSSQDSGIYRSVIQINGRQQNSENKVQVIDAVQEPSVTCKLNTSTKILFCSVSSQIQVTYEWTGSDLIKHSGQEFPVSKEEKPDSVFTCTVKNEVSRKNTSFALKDCPIDLLHPDNISENDNITLPVVLFIISAVIIIIVAVVMYFICKRRNKAKDKDSTPKMETNELSSAEAQDVIQPLMSIHYEVNKVEKSIRDDADEDVNRSLTNHHNTKNNEEPNMSEGANKTEKTKEAERTAGNESDEDVNQPFKNKHDAEKNEKQYISEDVAKYEKNEADLMNDHESDEDVNQSLTNSHNAENNEECISEDADKTEKNYTVLMDDHKSDEDVNRSLTNSHDAENNEEPNISEDADKTEKNEEAERTAGNECDADVNQSLTNSHNAESNAECISEDADKTEKTDTELMDDNESGEDLHNHEDDE